MYSRKQGKKIVEMLRDSGLEAYLIGSLEKTGKSDTDIDILLIDPPVGWRKVLDDRLGIVGKSQRNDWGGAVFLTKYGKVDIFVMVHSERTITTKGS